MNSSVPLDTTNSPQVVIELMYRLKIADVMSTPVITASRTTSLRSVQDIMKQRSITGVPIADGKRLQGIVSVDDIFRALGNGYIDQPVERHMTRNLIVLEDDMPLTFGISYMEKYSFGRFPVLNRNRELVGIVTSRDIIVALLLEVNKEVERMESDNQGSGHQRSTHAGTDNAAAGGGPLHTGGAPPHVDALKVEREFRVRSLDFENAGKASAEVKRVLKTAGFSTPLIRRVAIAAYELEMNLVVHSVGGSLRFVLDADRIEIVATDTGPGIPDVEAAVVEGFSTANDWIRSLGFGAGMGLANIKRVSSRFNISSTVPGGTLVQATVSLVPEQSAKPADGAN